MKINKLVVDICHIRGSSVLTNVHIEFGGTATADIVGGIYDCHHPSNFHLTILL